MIFHNSKTMEFVRLIHAKINRVLVGPDICDSLVDRWIAMLDWLASLYDMHVIILYLVTNLVSYDSTHLATKLHLVPDCVYLFICYHTGPAFTPLITVWYPQLIDQLSHLLHLNSRDPFLRTYRVLRSLPYLPDK